MGQIFEWIVPGEDSGKKVIHFLSERLGQQYTARFLKKQLEAHCLKINRKHERFASTTLKKGDHLVLRLGESAKDPFCDYETTRKKFNPDAILYEDDDFLIYNKPAGLSSDQESISNHFKGHFSKLLLIHRLDKETTGVLLLAKNESILERMKDEFRGFRVHKTYFTIVHGRMEESGVIELALDKSEAPSGHTISIPKKNGQKAITEWKLVKGSQRASFVICHPKTGRMHQIRVHCSSIGHPIVNDRLYGRILQPIYHSKLFSSHEPRLLLHASQISFIHPIKHEQLTIEAPLPADFQEALDLLHLA